LNAYESLLASVVESETKVAAAPAKPLAAKAVESRPSQAVVALAQDLRTSGFEKVR